MVEHTPGPWSFGRIGPRSGPVRLTNKTFVISPVAGPRFAYLPEGADHIQEANARLIAAAPDLLEACKDFALGRKEARECEGIMRAAIAKAEGR